MTSQERYSAHAQLEHLQSKYVGTGHADTTKLYVPFESQKHFEKDAFHFQQFLIFSFLCAFSSEWGVNQHRDSLALYVGYDSLASYIAVAENESIGRVKFNSLQRMIQPCGPPPPKEDD